MRALCAVLRCVAGVSLREVAQVRQSGVLTRMLLWTAGYLAVLNVVLRLTPSPYRPSVLSQVYGQLPAIAFFVPVAFLLAATFGGSRRRLPALGLGLTSFAVGVVMLGWCVPLANRAFFDANPGRSTEVSTGVTHVTPNKPGDGLMMAMGDYHRVGRAYLPASMFMNDVNLLQLARKVANGPESGGWSAIRWTSFFFAYLTACAIIPVLASVLKRRNSFVRIAAVAATAVLLWTQGSLPSPFGEFSLVWWLGAYWIPVAWMALCLIAVARRDTRLQIANHQ